MFFVAKLAKLKECILWEKGDVYIRELLVLNGRYTVMYFIQNEKGEFVPARYIPSDSEREYIKREVKGSDAELDKAIVEMNCEIDERIRNGEINEDWFDTDD